MAAAVISIFVMIWSLCHKFMLLCFNKYAESWSTDGKWCRFFEIRDDKLDCYYCFFLFKMCSILRPYYSHLIWWWLAKLWNGNSFSKSRVIGSVYLNFIDKFSDITEVFHRVDREFLSFPPRSVKIGHSDNVIVFTESKMAATAVSRQQLEMD